MAVVDDLRRLAAEDVVYLTRLLVNPYAEVGAGATEVLRGRVRQALSGNWVFNAFAGQNGTVGIELGSVQNSWSSAESPAAGIQVRIPYTVINFVGPGVQIELTELVGLTTVIPEDFAT